MTILLRRPSSFARVLTSSFESLSCTPSSGLYIPGAPSSCLVASRRRAYATIPPGNLQEPRDGKDNGGKSNGEKQVASKGKRQGKPAQGFERLYDEAGPMSPRTSGPQQPSSRVFSKQKDQGRAAVGFENLYEKRGPMSPESKASQSHASNLTKEEEESLERVLMTIKKGVPASMVKGLDDAFQDMKRHGIPAEVREILTNLRKGATLDLATAAKLTRLTGKMVREAAERKRAEEEGGASGLGTSQSRGQSSGGRGKKGKESGDGYFKVFTANIDTGTFLITAFLGYLLYRTVMPSENSKDITWQEFKTTFFDKGLVDKLTVLNGHRVRVDLHREATGRMYPDSPAQHANFRYYFSIGSVEAFDKKLEKAQNELGIPSSERIPVSYVDQVSWFNSFLSFAPSLALIGGLYWLTRRAGGSGGGQSGLFGMGKSRAKKFNHETDVPIRFKDVAGMDEAKQEIMEFVSFLKDPGQYQRLGAKIPRGALLSGPPGTGKTLLAKATAGESAVPFFSISGSEFVEIFVGVGASRVRDLFQNARKNTPCIIFIDEIDAVGKARGKGGFAGNDEREGTLNQILTEMDGFNTSEQVVVLAGTNRPDVLDTALLRPGRFDRHIAIDRPTMEGRKQIFYVHLSKIVTNEDMDHLTSRLAALTPGFSGADIANCVNEAALIGKQSICSLPFEKQFTIISL